MATMPMRFGRSEIYQVALLDFKDVYCARANTLAYSLAKKEDEP